MRRITFRSTRWIAPWFSLLNDVPAEDERALKIAVNEALVVDDAQTK